MTNARGLARRDDAHAGELRRIADLRRCGWLVDARILERAPAHDATAALACARRVILGADLDHVRDRDPDRDRALIRIGDPELPVRAGAPARHRAVLVDRACVVRADGDPDHRRVRRCEQRRLGVRVGADKLRTGRHGHPDSCDRRLRYDRGRRRQRGRLAAAREDQRDRGPPRPGVNHVGRDSSNGPRFRDSGATCPSSLRAPLQAWPRAPPCPRPCCR